MLGKLETPEKLEMRDMLKMFEMVLALEMRAEFQAPEMPGRWDNRHDARDLREAQGTR